MPRQMNNDSSKGYVSELAARRLSQFLSIFTKKLKNMRLLEKLNPKISKKEAVPELQQELGLKVA